MTDAVTLRARMVAGLEERGELPQVWRAAFTEVERHAFIPPLVWRRERGAEPNDLIPLHRAADPDTWLAFTYADSPVDTQVDDGHPAPDGTGHEVTSSASQPAVVANMLDALDVHPGMRVLEIGTGTGYNAALLAHRLGGHNVTSIEIDPGVAEQARAALQTTGYGDVTVITGDGADGHQPRACYDRVIATTAAATTVPYPWMRQTSPGGRIVLPMDGTYQPPGILTLTVHGDGSATGRFGGPAAFMALRAQRLPRPRGDRIVGEDWTESTTNLHPYHVAGDRAAALAVGLRVRSCHKHYEPLTTHTGRQWLLDPTTASWATVTIISQPPYPVRQGGPRKLWAEVRDAYRWWLDAGEPPVAAWLVTVDPHGQRIEHSADHGSSVRPPDGHVS